MKRLIASVITIGSLISPVLASAAGEPVARKGILTPAGFCTVASDMTLGVRFSGESYTQWLAANALGADRLDQIVSQRNADRTHMGLAPMNEIEEQAFRSLKLAEEARYQRTVGIDPGQTALCS